MALIEYYLPLRQAHLTAVTLSLALFAARGAGVLAGAAWPMHRRTRWASVTIDTLLLTAGVLLWAALGLNPARDLWLGAKLVLLVGYIVLGSFALRRARTGRARAIFYVASLGCAAFMLTVAWAHHPSGLWRLVGG